MNTTRESSVANESQVSDGSVTRLSSAEAIERLRAGEPVQNVEIERLTLSGTFSEPVLIERCTLKGLSIQSATFEQSVSFRGSKIHRPRFNRKTRFMSSLGLEGCEIRALKMSKISVEGSLKLASARFEHLVKIEAVKFGGISGFGATFGDWCELREVEVGNNADLRSCQFEQGLVLRDCKIGGELRLRGASFEKKLELNDTCVEKTIDLSKAKLRDFAYFDDLKLAEGTRFRLANAIADHMHIEPELLEGRLSSEESHDFETACLEYGLLKRNYANLHQYDEEDWAFYRFKQNQRRRRPLSPRHPIQSLRRGLDYLFLDLGCGYGVEPWRALRFGAFLILMFAMIYGLGVQHFIDPNVPVSDFPMIHPLNRFLFGLLTSVSVFTAGFTGDHLHSASGWVLIPLAIEAVMGTILWGLFIVAFSRKVIR
ncbi:MAG: hypothetical protein AAF664_20145 [Planctomycetota bacterium]